MPSHSMNSSSIYWSPHNVWIAKLEIEGGPYLPCPHPGCTLAFTAPGGLQWHSWTRKHKFTSNPPTPPSYACLLQRFQPLLTIKTSAKTPHTGCTGQTSDLQQLVPLYSDSEGSDNKLSPLGFLPSASVKTRGLCLVLRWRIRWYVGVYQSRDETRSYV